VRTTTLQPHLPNQPSAHHTLPKSHGERWAYLAVSALMALSFAEIAANGPTVVGWASVLASQGKLTIVVMLTVAALEAEAGGLPGYSIGDRRGRQRLDRPDRRGERLRQTLTRAEA
jgi:membrane protein DedA with SNARE-associated domain